MHKLTWKGFLRSSSMEMSILMLSQPRLEWILRDTGNWRPPRLRMRRLTLSSHNTLHTGHLATMRLITRLGTATGSSSHSTAKWS